MPAIYSHHMDIPRLGGDTGSAASPSIIIEEPKTYIYTLDGETQYHQFSEAINLEAGDVVEFNFVNYGNVGNYKRFIGSTNYAFSLDSGSAGNKFRIKAISSATLNGEPLSSGTTIPVTGINTVSFIMSSNQSITSLLSLGGGNLTKAAMYNFSVSRGGEVIHFIPLTSRGQGANQSASVGGVSSTIVNYSESGWSEI